MSKQSLFYSRPVIGVAGLTDPAPVKGDVFLPAVRGIAVKTDAGKIRMELMAQVSRAYEGVAKVLTWAVTDKKPVPYVPGSWQGVDDFYNRYLGALKRHLVNIERNGPYVKDAETQLLDLYHLATDAMFLAEMASRDIEAARNGASPGAIGGHKFITNEFRVPNEYQPPAASASA